MIDLADGYSGWTEAFCDGLRPDPDLWVDQWADAHMVIPKKIGSKEPGRYRTDRTPYARGVMRALSPQDPCRRVVVMGASQLLKTQVAINWIGACIHQSPANILALFPTENLVKRVSHRINETIKSVPELSERVAPPRSRDARNTINTKEFDGGTLYMGTARSASNLSEISCRYIYGDELDRWVMDLGSDGNSVEVAEARTSTFEFDAKIYYSSSPTLEGASLIQQLYLQSDQRRYYVPCPQCGTLHELLHNALGWDDALTKAWMVCSANGCMIEEHHKTDMLDLGEWRAHAAGDGQTAGFQISQLYAPLGWTSWLGIARKYAKAKAALSRGDHGPMQVIYNTRFALTYDPAGDERVIASQLQAKADAYGCGEIPPGALVLTFATDVQGGRLETLIMGWGVGMECWVIDYQVLQGRPTEAEVWIALDALISRPLVNRFGVPMRITAGCIDTGGNATQDVYNYVRSRRRSNVMAIKGSSRPNRPVIAAKPSKVDVNWKGQTIMGGVELWMIGSDTGKDWFSTRWMLPPGPGAIHFPRDLPAGFYDQLAAERKLIRYVKGYARAEWIKTPGEANDGLDLCVYNLAAANYLGLHRRRDWETLRLALEQPPGIAPPDAAISALAQKSLRRQSITRRVRL